MESIQSFFVTEAQIELTKAKEPFYSFLSDKFENVTLENALNSISDESSQFFSLSFDSVFSFQIKSLENFTLIVNDTIFKTNRSFLCCFSKSVFQAFNQDPSLSSYTIQFETENEEELNCVSSFIKFLKGNSFSFDGFSSESFIKVVDQLNIVGFENILFQLYLVPTNFQEALIFLQKTFSSSLKSHFEKSLQIISSKFYKFNLGNAPPFGVDVFEEILRSSELKLQNETILFQIILEKMKLKSNFQCLLKYVQFCFVQSKV
jgi:hypothetical protein